MARIQGPRVARVASLVGTCLFLVGCGSHIEGTAASAPGETRGIGNATVRIEAHDADAIGLARDLEADLVRQGVATVHARAIAQGALDGSRMAVDSMGLVDLKSFLPGFLRGALGVAKTLFAGTPAGVAGTIVETIVRGFAKRPSAPKDVLRSLPAIALEALSAKGGGLPDLLGALLAAGRGVTAGATPDDSRSMMEALVTALVRQPGMRPDALTLLLPALQDSLQDRIVAMPRWPGAGGPISDPAEGDDGSGEDGFSEEPPGVGMHGGRASSLGGLLAAISEGQFKALLGMRAAEPSQRDALLSLLLRRGAESLVARAGLEDEGLRLELLQALAAGAARPLGALGSLAKETKQDMLRDLASALTRSVLEFGEVASPLRRQALEATLLGLSRGMISTRAASEQELSEVFARVSQALGRGVVAQPGGDDSVRRMLLAALGQAQVRAVDTAGSGFALHHKEKLLASALRGLASGVSTATPQGELVEVLLAVLNARAARPSPPPMPVTEEELLRVLELAQAGL